MTLTIYSKNACQYCDMAKNLLKSKGVAYTEVRIDQDDTARNFLISEGHRAVPQIYQNGKLFVQGGYQGLAKMSDEELKAAHVHQ